MFKKKTFVVFIFLFITTILISLILLIKHQNISQKMNTKPIPPSKPLTEEQLQPKEEKHLQPKEQEEKSLEEKKQEIEKFEKIKTELLKISKANPEAQVFYYIWYQNPTVDKKFEHWNHKVLPHWTDSVNKKYPNIGVNFDASKDSIGANYFPKRGLYSSNSENVVIDHFLDMYHNGIGTAIVSWWGTSQSDENGSNGDSMIPILLKCAEITNMKIVFHLEPYKDRSALSTKKDVQYIIDKYGDSPAFYRWNGKPMFYIYDSYLIPENDWMDILSTNGKNTIRKTKYDSLFISLYLDQKSNDFVLRSNFDGVYTYFASVGFTFGSTPVNWNLIQNWCLKYGKIFIPSVGPGYDDTR
jgi:glycoprotein endo-alpha-1,2-mannosidase